MHRPEAGPGAAEEPPRDGAAAEEQYHPVHCAACDTEVGLRELPPSGLYHFFNVFASSS